MLKFADKYEGPAKYFLGGTQTVTLLTQEEVGVCHLLPIAYTRGGGEESQLPKFIDEGMRGVQIVFDLVFLQK